MKKIHNDRGISLIEIVIALAILALLMTAVVALMTSNTIIFRKTKDDIKVQTQAEETFNNLSDTLNAAKYIYVEGFLLNGSDEIRFSSDNLPISTALEIAEGPNSDKTTSFVSSDTFTSSTFSSLAGQSYTDESGVTKSKIRKVYITKMVVLYATSIDFAADLGATVSTLSDGITKVASFNGNGTQSTTNNVADLSDPHNGIDLMDDTTITRGANGSISLNPKSGNHKVYISDSDYCLATFYFDQNNIYVTRQYLYNTAYNTKTVSGAPSSWSEDERNMLKFSDCLSYAKNGEGYFIPGAVGAFDAKNGCVGIELYFNDGSMTYSVNQLIKIKNSYVLKDAN